jgi:hypothetical protein
MGGGLLGSSARRCHSGEVGHEPLDLLQLGHQFARLAELLLQLAGVDA